MKIILQCLIFKIKNTKCDGLIYLLLAEYYYMILKVMLHLNSLIIKQYNKLKLQSNSCNYTSRKIRVILFQA